MIADRSIAEVLEKSVIEDVIGEFVELKKSGSVYQGLSPFSNERTPSFNVVPKKNIFKCFSSGKGGNVVTFLMEHKGMNFPEAMHWLAAKYNVILEEDGDYESNDEKKKERLTKKENISKLLRASQKAFKEALKSDDDATQYLLKRGITEDDIVEWQLGFGGREWDWLTKKVTDSALWSEGVEIGLLFHKNKTVDAYRNRITIPISDKFGNIIGFGGRIISDDKPKYINPRESDIYVKESVLFGLEKAMKSIKSEAKAYISEGYFDIISLHRAGVINSVAAGGTAIGEKHINELRKCGAQKIAVFTDGDDAGIKGALRAIPLIFSAGLSPVIVQMPDGKDPDDLVKEGMGKDDFNALEKDGILWMFDYLYADGDDVVRATEAVAQISAILIHSKQQMRRDFYINSIAKQYTGISKSVFIAELNRLEKEIASKASKNTSGIEETPENGVHIPSSADRSFYDKYGFYEHKGAYEFYDKGGFMRGTNFIIQPLFHINNMKDDKRLMELIRPDRRSVVEVPSVSMVSMSMFMNALVCTPGNYTFLAGMTTHHFRQLMLFLGEEMPVAKPLITLGMQPEGFFAFADGIVDGYKFTFVDDYGIVMHIDNYKDAEGIEHSENLHYFLPAYSKMYKNVRADEDEYENERRFKHVQSRITLKRYFELFSTAFGREKSIIGLSFMIAACFRDLFITKYNSFPLLYAYGEKGSGKSEYLRFIQNFFYVNQDPFMLNAGTEVGFFRRLARVRNVCNFFDEFTDNVDEGRFQALKSSWNGVGREKGVMSRDNRTEISKVHSAVMVGGQYLSNRDDGSLPSRSIILPFSKQERTQETIEAFLELKKEIEHGLNSLVIDIIRFRNDIKSQIEKEFQGIKMKLRDDFLGEGVMDRCIDNYAMILAPVKILHRHLPLPFTYDELYAKSLEGIKRETQIMSQSEDVGSFWQIIEDLIENKELIENNDYKFFKPPHVALDGEQWSNHGHDEVFVIRYNRAHGVYQKEFKKRYSGGNANDATSLQQALKSRDYFIGTIGSFRFNAKVTSVFAFNYTKMQGIGISLKTEFGEKKDTMISQPELTSTGSIENDDLPF